MCIIQLYSSVLQYNWSLHHTCDQRRLENFLWLVSVSVPWISFSALTLFVRRQEGHPVRKKAYRAQGWIRTLRGPKPKHFEGPHHTGNTDRSQLPQSDPRDALH